MKKLSICLLLALSMTLYAGIKAIGGYDDNAVFYQFTHDHITNTGDYTNGSNPGQNWLGAQTIQLHVTSSMDVWITNYVQSWYEPITDLNGNIYNMESQQYGATELNGSRSWIGTGATTDVTYFDGDHTNTATGYFLGHFDGNDDVYLWMTTTPADGDELVTSIQLVKDGEVETTLVSRVDGTHDLAGNVRLNFGIDSETYGYIGREFVAIGVSEIEDIHGGGTSGQPLPGLFTSALIASGVIGFASRKRRKK